MLGPVATPAEALCPRCQASRPPSATECPSCGVIYARYAPPRPRPVPPAAPPPAPERPHSLPVARLEALCQRMAEMLESGLAVRQVLTGPLLGTLPGPLAEALRRGAESDAPLSEILEPLRLLDGASLALVRAGEARGGLPQALQGVAQRLHERRVSRNVLLGSLAYPAFLLLCAAVILPAPTLFTSGLGAYLGLALPPVMGLAAVGLAFALWPRLAPEAAPRRALRALGRALPLTRSVLRHHGLAAFAGVLGDCLRAGLPARQALSLATGATTEPTLRSQSAEAVRRLDAGATLVGALEPLGLPPEFLAEIAAAEHTGTLDRAFPRLAAAHHERARRATRVVLVVAAAAFFGLTALVVAASIIRGYSAAFSQLEQTVDQIERR